MFFSFITINGVRVKFFFLENRDSPQLLKKAYNRFTEVYWGCQFIKERIVNGKKYLENRISQVT